MGFAQPRVNVSSSNKLSPFLFCKMSSTSYVVKEDLITKDELLEAIKRVETGPLPVHHTPCIEVINQSKGLCMFESETKDCDLVLKLENMQSTNSFKIRGVSNQFQAHQVMTQHREFVTMSGGNYGRAFAFASNKLDLNGNRCLMPDTAPLHRSKAIESMGVTVERLPSANLRAGVKKHEEDGMIFLHPFDDRHLIAGHGSLGKEILEDVPDVDFVLICCGGGGLLAGASMALKMLTERSIRVFGVEPETACGMHKSLKADKALQCPEAKSVAGGLAPPFQGENAFYHVRTFVEDILLVSDEELRQTVKLAYDRGLVVEPSGAAALAAFLTGKLEQSVGRKEVCGKKIVAVITGSNVSPAELVDLLPS